MSAILVSGVLPNRPIGLQTRERHDIENSQERDFTPFARNQFREIERKFPNVEPRTQELPIYNCHGLTFAARRTWIWSHDAIRMILADDGYTEVPREQVKLGDIIIYMDNNGDFEHSGIVVAIDDRLKLPKVVSKWGGYKELIHWANQCPYDFARALFYRVTR